MKLHVIDLRVVVEGDTDDLFIAEKILGQWGIVGVVPLEPIGGRGGDEGLLLAPTSADALVEPDTSDEDLDGVVRALRTGEDQE